MKTSITQALVLATLCASCVDGAAEGAAVPAAPVTAPAPAPPIKAYAGFCDVKVYSRPSTRGATPRVLSYNEELGRLEVVDPLWSRVVLRDGATGYVRSYALRDAPGAPFWVPASGGCIAPAGMRPGTEHTLAVKAARRLAKLVPREAGLALDPIAGDEAGTLRHALTQAVATERFAVAPLDSLVTFDGPAVLMMGTLRCAYAPGGQQVVLTLDLEVRDVTTGQATAKLAPIVQHFRNCPSA